MKLFLTGFNKLDQMKALERLAAGVCGKVTKLKKSGEINFILVSDKEIKKLHKKFLDDASATDVITFQYLKDATIKTSGPDSPFGDIYISLDTARAQARAAGHETYQEVAFLMVHGLLHLAGYDDHMPGNRTRMLALQSKLIKKISPKLAPAN